MLFKVLRDGSCVAASCPSCAPPYGLPFDLIRIDGANGDTTQGVATLQGFSRVRGREVQHWAHDRGQVG